MAAAVSNFTPISATPIDESASAAFQPISNTPINEAAAAAPSTMGMLGGMAETGLHFASGAVAPFGGGLTYLAALALTRGDTSAAKAVQEATENALTYQPRTDTGQALDTAIDTLGQATIGKATDFLSDKAASIGGPLAGAAARTVLEGAPYVLGGGEAVSAARGVVKAVSNPAAVVRDMAGAVRTAAPSAADAGAEAGTAEAGGAAAPAPEVSPVTVGPQPAAGAAVPTADQAAIQQATKAQDFSNVDPGNPVNPGNPAGAPVTSNAPPAGPAGPTVTPPPGVSPDATIGMRTQNPPVFWNSDMADALQAKGAAFPDAQTLMDNTRASTLKEIGLTEARNSAVTGDKAGAATDYQQAKVDNEGGQAASQVFENERAALGNYTDQLVADTGGSTGLDETSLYNRGQTMLTPFQELSDAYDHQVSQLYAQADATAQGMPVDLNSTAATLGNRPSFIGTTDGQQLLRGINAYMRQAGIMDDAGSLQGATVQQAERLKQYLNDQWSPRTAKLIRGVKDAIDEDVAQSAGGDVYQNARAMRASRAKLLDNPQGVASLLKESGPDGINRTVNIERIPDQVARMPVDQFNHIVNTLESMPPELGSKARAALGEIRSQLMLRMQERAERLKGNWDNKAVTQYLNRNRMKIAKVFTPDEIQRIVHLNNAGNILDVNRAYPGAAVQGHNLMTRGAIAAAPHVAAAVVGHIPIVGGAVSHMVGNKVAGIVEGASSAKAWQKRMQKL